MSARNTLTTIFLSISFSVLAGGISKLIHVSNEDIWEQLKSIDLPVVFFVAFFVLFRIKLFLDDVMILSDDNPENGTSEKSIFRKIIEWCMGKKIFKSLSKKINIKYYTIFVPLYPFSLD